MAGYGPVVGWEGDLVGVDNVMGLVFFRTNPPERGYATSLPILRGDADRRPHKDHAHRNRDAAIAQINTLLAGIPSQSVKTDPSVSPLADSFCRAARGRCKCRTSEAGGVLRGEHHFLSNFFGTYHHHPLRARRAAFRLEKFRLRGQHSAQDGLLPPTSRR